MEHIKRFFNKTPHETPYLLVLFVIFLGVFISNFPDAGRFLTGWDNLHPEFNFGLNFKRVIDIWQSNEGLGLVGGHGYAATLPHTIFLFFLSFIFPISSLRALFTFLMLLVGSLGIFFLTKHVLSKNGKNQFNLNAASLIAGLFYMLNIGTVQNFYIQLEAFIVHFAFLPWLIISLFLYLESPNRKSLALFLLANVLILPAQFIPPLFIVEGIIISSILLVFYLSKRSKKSLREAAVVLFAIFLVNAYWLLPFGAYTIKYSKNYLNAYNNIQSTSEFIQKNLKYGGIKDVPIIKSFLFEANDIDIHGNLFHILKPWENHLNSPLILSLAYGFFLIALIGVISLLKKPNLDFSSRSLLLIFGIIFTLFATDIPPFSFVSAALRFLSPLFEQAFRVTFTKFSIAYVMLLSFFLGAGFIFLIEKISVKNLKRFLLVIFTLLLIVYAAPSFSGNFTYKNVKLIIPQSYFSLFSYMEDKPQTDRIMNLSQGWNWGWTLYTWGYTGSGFLWYGLEQPILDRAFDVWSPYNENYYWEIERALFSKDYNALDSLFEKYHISWVLFDPTVVSYPGERQAIYDTATQQYLSTSQKFSLEKTFGNLKLYKVKLNNKPENDILEYTKLQNVLPTYQWTNKDEAAILTNAYFSDAKEAAAVYFPFRSIFTARKVSEKEFSIQKESSGVTLSNTIPQRLLGENLTQDYSDPFVKTEFNIERKGESTFTITLKFDYPTLSENQKPEISWSQDIPRYQQIYLNVNSDFYPLSSYGEFIPFSRVLNLVSNKNNIVNFVVDGNPISTKTILPPKPELSNIAVSSSEVKLYIPFSSDTSSYNSSEDPSFVDHKEHNCETPLEAKQKLQNEGSTPSLLFSTTNEQKQCFDIILPSLSQATGYLIEINSKHLSGENLQFALVSQQPKKSEYQVSLPGDKDFTYSYLVVPAMQRDGLGYSLHFENDSTIKGDTVNLLRSVRVTPIPYNYLTNLRIGELGPVSSIPDISSKKILPGFYMANISKDANYIVLSQSFDNSWVAIGKGVSRHILINNWANGWKVDPQKANKVYIVFLPEVFVVLGFILTAGSLILILKKRIYHL